MNTTITFKVVQNKETTIDILDGVEEGFGEFERIVRKYTRFNQNSELSNLNRLGGEWVKVSKEFFWLIEYMLKLAEKTDGVFDPTIIDYLEVYGYDPDYNFKKLENPDLDNLIQKISNERSSWSEIEVDKKQSKVRLQKGQRIDLGGIGKGYAIDCAFEKLARVSENFLIDAGGDIRVRGRNEEGKKWRVGLKDNRIKTADSEPELVGYVELEDEALACSGSWARKVKQFHHLINPKTGKPENTYRTVYVHAKTGIESDSWATAIFVGGDNLVSKIPDEIKFFAIKDVPDSKN